MYERCLAARKEWKEGERMGVLKETPSSGTLACLSSTGIAVMAWESCR